MENPREAAKKFIRALHRQYDSVASQPIACAQCKIKPGVNFCGGECKDANVRYCSQVCANLHWSDHMCLIAGKDKRQLEGKESPRATRKEAKPGQYGLPGVDNETIVFNQVLRNNEAFLQILVDRLTLTQVVNYSLVSKSFRAAIVQNPLFWFLFLKKHFPFRLLVLHARAARSNDVSIDVRRNDVDYERFGSKILYDNLMDLEWKIDPSTYAEVYNVEPVHISYNALEKAYAEANEKLNIRAHDNDHDYYIRWDTPFEDNSMSSSDSLSYEKYLFHLKLYDIFPDITTVIVARYR